MVVYRVFRNFKTEDWSAASSCRLIAMLKHSCAVSADLTGVNAFDQPGVEGLQNYLFGLLGNTGFKR